MQQQHQTRVLLADDHQIVRQGLRSLLEHISDMTVVGEAADGRSTVELANELQPDVVVMDVSMPGLNGIEATRQLMSKKSPGPSPKVVAMSMHSDRRFATEMLNAGARAYLLKDSAFEELAEAIRTVISNKVFVSKRIAEAMQEQHASGRIDDVSHGDGDGNGNGHGFNASAFASLTPREREVLQLLAEGKATKEVARALSVSVKTVETHRRQLMEKLKMFSVAELTKYAIREGITSLE
jgi:DNA-binding NarL/FixJ family response regulator